MLMQILLELQTISRVRTRLISWLSKQRRGNFPLKEFLTFDRHADAEAKRRKKRATDDGDISYINKRNKVFNQKLARYVQ
jgi:SYF2 splicing factor